MDSSLRGVNINQRPVRKRAASTGRSVEDGMSLLLLLSLHPHPHPLLLWLEPGTGCWLLPQLLNLMTDAH